VGVTGTISTQTAGQAFNAAVYATDSRYNLTSTVTANLNLTSSDPNNPNLGDYGMGQRSATLSNIVLYTAGNQTLTAAYATGPSPLDTGVSAAFRWRPPRRASCVFSCRDRRPIRATNTDKGRKNSPTTKRRVRLCRRGGYHGFLLEPDARRLPADHPDRQRPQRLGQLQRGAAVLAISTSQVRLIHYFQCDYIRRGLERDSFRLHGRRRLASLEPAGLLNADYGTPFTVTPASPYGLLTCCQRQRGMRRFEKSSRARPPATARARTACPPSQTAGSALQRRGGRGRPVFQRHQERPDLAQRRAERSGHVLSAFVGSHQVFSASGETNNPFMSVTLRTAATGES